MKPTLRSLFLFATLAIAPMAMADSNACGSISVPKCPAGQAPNCVLTGSGILAIPSWICSKSTSGITGKAVTSFMISHVVYALPGHGSTMSYGSSFGYGSTTMLSADQNTNISVSFGAGINVKDLTKDDFSTTFGSAWGNTTNSSADMLTTYTDGYKLAAQNDDINHNDDEIWFLAGPNFDVVLTQVPSLLGISTPHYNLNWELDPNAPNTSLTYLLVGELNGAYPVTPWTLTYLAGYGITPADFPEILKADPFAGPAVHDAPIDPARYEWLREFDYHRMPPDTTTPSIQSWTIDRKTTSTSTSQKSIQLSVDVKLSGSFTFLDIANVTAGAEGKWVETNTVSAKQTTATDTSQSLALGQPLSTYVGPNVLNVWEDKIFHTFLFTLDSKSGEPQPKGVKPIWWSF